MTKLSKQQRYKKLVEASSKKKLIRFPLADIEFGGVVKLFFNPNSSPSEKRIEVAEKIVELMRRRYGIIEHLVYGSAGFRGSTPYSDLDIEAIAPKLRKKRDGLFVVENPATGEHISVNLRLYPSLSHSRYTTDKTHFPVVSRRQLRGLRPIDLLHTLIIDKKLVKGNTLMARNWVANTQGVGFALERILFERRKQDVVVTPKEVTDIILRHFFVKRETNKLAGREPAIRKIQQNVQDILHMMSPWTKPIDIPVEKSNGFIEPPKTYDPNARYIVVNWNNSLEPNAHRFYRLGSLANYFLNIKKNWGYSKQIALWLSGVR